MTLNVDSIITAAEACRYMRDHGQNVTQRMISDWRRAGHVKVRKRQRVGQVERPLYRLGDLLQTEADMRDSAQSHRKQLQRAA